MKIKGIINWVKRDAETLQVIDEFEVTNVITDYALRELIVNKYHFGDSIGISNDVLVADRKDNIMHQLMRLDILKLASHHQKHFREM